MPYTHLKPDLESARRFLRFLDAECVERNGRFLFLWIPSTAGERAREEPLSAEDYCRVYPAMLREGWQPFVCVNAMKGRKRANAEVAAYRAYFLDFDKPPVADASALPPHCIVQSHGGPHWYWKTADNKTFWREVETSLAHHFGADLRAIDPARVLRMPGSWHLKDPANPFLVTLEKCETPERPTAGHELINAFSLVLNQHRAATSPEEAGTWTKADIPEKLRVLFQFVEHAGFKITRRPGKAEWYFNCPIRKHKSAKVVVILNGKGDWTLFCQSGKECCTRDAILEAFGTGWPLRYSSGKYDGKSST